MGGPGGKAESGRSVAPPGGTGPHLRKTSLAAPEAGSTKRVGRHVGFGWRVGKLGELFGGAGQRSELEGTSVSAGGLKGSGSCLAVRVSKASWKASRLRSSRRKARGAVRGRQVARREQPESRGTKRTQEPGFGPGNRSGTGRSAPGRLRGTKGLRRRDEDLEEDRNRRGERRTGWLNPSSDERFDSRNKASKSSDPEVAVAGSRALSGAL